MGNYFMKCCVGVAVIRVMRPNGRIDEFDYPVTAAQVMRRYPEHLVIQSTYNSAYEDARRKVSIVRPETKLVPGREYILYPIPEQYRETVAHSVAKQAHDSLSASDGDYVDGLQHHQQEFSRRRWSTRSRILGATRHHLANILRSAREFKVGDEDWYEESPPRAASRMTLRGRMDVDEKRCKVAGAEDEENEMEEEEEEFSFCHGASWKPSLCSIPESPVSPPSSPISPIIADTSERW